MKDKNLWLIIVVFLIAAIISWNSYFRKYLQKDTVDISVFPAKLGGWASEDLPISDLDYSILETRNVFVRRYTKGDKEAFLFIVYSQNNRKVSHPPEVCYVGGGVTILGRTSETVDVQKENLKIQTNRLLLSKGETKQIALYWFKVGNIFTPSYWKQQLIIALKNLFGHSAGSALIRVSVTVESNEAQAIEEAKDFSSLIIPEILKNLP